LPGSAIRTNASPAPHEASAGGGLARHR
jgi:hypothetical protein